MLPSLLSSVLALALSLATPATPFVVYPEAFHQPSPAPSSAPVDDTPLPLVIWHGLGDRFDAEGLKEVAELADEVHPGTYVHIIRLADDGGSDRTASFFGNVTKQIEMVCEQLASDNILSTAPAIDALGFSQGGQFLRGYVERCNKPPVRNLITFGSQHNGIAEFQKCASATDFVCQGANALLRSGTWTDFVQSRLVPAQYFRNLAELDNYIESSNYLADINNERPLKNAQYKKNLASLNKFVMYLFKNDKTVIPKETGWFAEVNTTSDEVTYLKDRTIYKEDWLGLKTLDEKGGLVFEVLDGEHMQFSNKDLKNIFKTYLGPEEPLSDTSSRAYNTESLQVEL